MCTITEIQMLQFGQGAPILSLILIVNAFLVQRALKSPAMKKDAVTSGAVAVLSLGK